MIKKIVIGIIMAGLSGSLSAESLLDVYRDAFKNDPTFKAALATRMAAQEILPQSISLVLPQLSAQSKAGLSKTHFSGSAIDPAHPHQTTRSIGFSVNLSQSLFNLSDWVNIRSASYTVKAAVATYNAAIQDLMIRTVDAYFGVLQAKDVLRFTQAEKQAYKSEYDRAYQSYKVGVKTMTDVYNAKAAYDSSVAQDVVAQNALENSREDLRAITGMYYANLDTLTDKLPLLKPTPADIESWVQTATNQNWSLTAARHNTAAAKDQINVKRAEHLFTVDLAADYSEDYARVLDWGNQRAEGPAASLNVTLPLFSGGAITSAVRQAIANYELAESLQEETYRSVVNVTRKSYLGVLSNISQIKADEQVIISNRSSLDGMREGYKVGIRTMVDVLNGEKALYGSERDYAIDRYTYIRNLVQLKQSAGTLSEDDVLAVNEWLVKAR